MWGGDVYTGPKFAIDAIAAGREGAISLHRFVHEHCTLTIGRNRRDFIELDKDNIFIASYDNTDRQRPERAEEAQLRSFRDLSNTLTEEQVKAETSRMPWLRRFGGRPQQVYRLRYLHNKMCV